MRERSFCEIKLWNVKPNEWSYSLRINVGPNNHTIKCIFVYVSGMGHLEAKESPYPMFSQACVSKAEIKGLFCLHLKNSLRIPFYWVLLFSWVEETGRLWRLKTQFFPWNSQWNSSFHSSWNGLLRSGFLPSDDRIKIMGIGSGIWGIFSGIIRSAQKVFELPNSLVFGRITLSCITKIFYQKSPW